MSEVAQERLVYSVSEVARLLSLSRNGTYEAIRRGQIPGAVKVGRRVLISKHRLHEWLHAEAET